MSWILILKRYIFLFLFFYFFLMFAKEGILALCFSLVFFLLFYGCIIDFINKRDWFIISLAIGLLVCYGIFFWRKIKYFFKNLSTFCVDIFLFLFVDAALSLSYLFFYTKSSFSFSYFEKNWMMFSHTFSIIPLEEWIIIFFFLFLMQLVLLFIQLPTSKNDKK